ncbi:hypothetical protein F5Y04DRAFT_261451 [Hypomontagnella monticulosa]|nr:hypothetical protein F5Y04DRAFT_261451 [Hypomontagnella monticulosa]
MFSTTSMVAFGGRGALFHNPPRGTCSRILSLRLYRRSRVAVQTDTNNRWPIQCTYYSTHSLARGKGHYFTEQEYALFRDILKQAKPNLFTRGSYGDAVSADESPNSTSTQTASPSTIDPLKTLSNPFRRALTALQRRDTRFLIISLQRITKMREQELQDAFASIPRTTFTEFLRSLDPLCIARDVDPADQMNITPRVYQLLDMKYTVDVWGVRLLYIRLLQCMLDLVAALKASGHTLLMEEYIYLIRCAGAASDPKGAKWLWQEMDRAGTTHWRHSEAYAEFISARFLTRPLYSGYDKTRRMVTPRNLHRSRLKLSRGRVKRLYKLVFRHRLKRLKFGLNKDVTHAEEIMRMLRKKLPALRILWRITADNHTISEPLLCSVMIALGRAGYLRYIGTRILDQWFGICMTHGLTWDPEKGAGRDGAALGRTEISAKPPVIRPTVRLMEAIVETYGSNGEIAIAFQLVDFISTTYGIPIPSSIWRELLEWTYIMTCPPASTAWGYAGMSSKISSHSAIEAIWSTMTSAPYNIEPEFEQYDIIIRNLLARHHFSKVIPLIREATNFYDAQCQEYTEAVLEYVQVVRDGLGAGASLHRYEKARFKKAKMHYDIQKWCGKFLAGVRSYSIDNPLTTAVVPDFIHEFRPYIPNPAKYRTSTGYVNLHDPSRETMDRKNSRIIVEMPKLEKGTLNFVKRRLGNFVGRSQRSLAGHAPVIRFNLYNLLTGTSRLRWDWETTSNTNDETRTEKPLPLSDESAKTPEQVAQAQNWDDDEDF